jgi:plasmid stabilization system protein ParE
MKLHISEAARDEINGIARWYDQQPSRYGSAFLDEIEAALLAIRATPRACGLAGDGRPGCEDREYYIARFKQRVIFTIMNETAYLLTVVHASRKEGRWQESLPPNERTETSHD